MTRLAPSGWILFLAMASLASPSLAAQSRSPGEKPSIKQPSLIELAKLYKDLDLPLPPKKSFFAMVDDDIPLTSAPASKPEITYKFHFAIGGPYPKAPYGVWQSFHFIPEETLAKIFPKPPNPEEVLSFLRLGRLRGSFNPGQEDYGELVFAIQCHLLEHFELAKFFYRRCQKSATKPFDNTLILIGWDYWAREIGILDRDLALVNKKLRHIVDKHRFFELLNQGPPDEREEIERDIKDHHILLERLALTLKPSQAKPGSIEALIDELLIDPQAGEGWDLIPPEDKDPEDKGKPSEQGKEKRLEAKKRPDAKTVLRNMGFAAVPKLIEHVDDMRLIRHYPMSQGGNGGLGREGGSRLQTINAKSYRTVGSSVREILPAFFVLNQYEATKADYLKAWNEIKKIEESDFVAKRFESTEDQTWQFLHFSREKYIDTVIEAYKMFLRKNIKVEYMTFLIHTVAESNLPKVVKVDLLVQGVRSGSLYEQYRGLSELVTLDNAIFSKLCVEALEKAPKTGLEEKEERWRLLIVDLGFRSEDPMARAVFEKSIKDLPLNVKLESLARLCNAIFAEKTGPKTLSFLSSFLDDATLYSPGKEDRRAWSNLGNDLNRIEVRNYVALSILKKLGIKITVTDKTSEETWTKIRELTKDEIARRQEINQRR